MTPLYRGVHSGQVDSEPRCWQDLDPGLHCLQEGKELPESKSEMPGWQMRSWTLEHADPSGNPWGLKATQQTA